MILARRELLCGWAAMLATRPALAAGPVTDLLGRIAKARAPVRTLQGPFTQTRTIGLLSTDVRSTGSLTLVRPDSLRWRLDPPDDITFWVGSEGVAYRSAHGHGRLPATNGRMASALRDLHELLGGDPSRLADRWSITVLRDDATGAQIQALPLASDASALDSAVARRLELVLAADLVRPTRVLLAQGDHDRTAIVFGDLAINAPVDESSMRPPG